MTGGSLFRTMETRLRPSERHGPLGTSRRRETRDDGRRGLGAPGRETQCPTDLRPRESAPLGHQTILLQAYGPVTTDDDVVHDLDAQQLRRRHQLSGQRGVVRARRRITAGMVVADD